MILKQYLNLKYNTIYLPFNQDGTENESVIVNKLQNYGGEKRVDIGGGYVGDDLSDQATYGIYCKARGLFGFDTNDIDASITGLNQSSYLRLYNLGFVPTTYTPTSLSIEIFPITAYGESGTENSTDPSTGYSNGMYRTSSDLGTSSGGLDVDSSMSALKTLNPGNKHIELDITNIIQHSLTSGVRYYGFLLKLSDDIESTTATSYGRKSLYSGDFISSYQFPRIDVTYDDYITDDRDSLVAGQLGRLYFYNEINATPTEISFDSASLTIVNENDEALTSSVNVLEDNNYAGYYYADITLPLSAGASYHDYRDRGIFTFDGHSTTSTNYVKILGNTNRSNLSKDVSLLLNKEESNNLIFCSISFNEKRFLGGKKTMVNEGNALYIPKNCYYRIYAVDEASKEKFIQSDGDRVSYNKDGCWFNIDKTLFPRGKFYIEIKADLFGKTLEFSDRKWYFINEEDFITNELNG